MKNDLKRFIYTLNGSTAIEYALIASLISIFILLTLVVTGTSVEDLYTRISTAILG